MIDSKFAELVQTDLGATRQVYNAIRRSDGEFISAWEFCNGNRLADDIKLETEVWRKGLEADFSISNYGVPIISKKARDALIELESDDFQIFEVSTNSAEIYVLNVLKIVDCFNTDLSIYRQKEEKYVGVEKLVINDKDISADCFRIKNHSIPLIVSINVVEALVHAKIEGIAVMRIGSSSETVTL